jgi:hypothetical protein
MTYFPDGESMRELYELHFKIPLNPPISKGDEDGFSPLAKGSQRGFSQNDGSIWVLLSSDFYLPTS